MQQSNTPILIIEPSRKLSYKPSNYYPSPNPSPVPSFNPSYHTSSQPASSLMPTSLPSYQPTVVANAPASCMDYPHGWVDADGINCEYYAHPGYCNKFGSKFAKSGKTANQACCVCGGGTVGGAKKYSQPWFNVYSSTFLIEPPSTSFSESSSNHYDSLRNALNFQPGSIRTSVYRNVSHLRHFLDQN